MVDGLAAQVRRYFELEDEMLMLLMCVDRLEMNCFLGVASRVNLSVALRTLRLNTGGVRL